MNKKLARLLESGLRKYFLCPVLFALITLYFSVPLAVGELVMVGVLYIYFHVNNSQRKKEVAQYLGYDNVYYFSNIFKSYYGMSPTYFIKQYDRKDVDG
jgi:AraC-like DNA-binding protein